MHLLILRLMASKHCIIFLNIILLRCFLSSADILTFRFHHLCILITFLVCDVSHHHRKKDSPLCSFSFSPSSHVKLSSTCCRSALWVPSCAVVSHGVVACSGQYWLLLFFLRFWLMLGTAFTWVGSNFSRLWCCLPRCWLVVDNSCLSWFSRSCFCWSDFYALFHS